MNLKAVDSLSGWLPRRLEFNLSDHFRRFFDGHDPGRLPMVESFLSDMSEAYTTDTTERPEESQPSSLTASLQLIRTR